MPSGKRAHANTYLDGRWVTDGNRSSRTKRIMGPKAEHRIEHFVSRAFGLPLPKPIQNSKPAAKARLFIRDPRYGGDLPIVLLDDERGARPVGEKDLSTIEKVRIRWDDKKATELKRLTAFTQLREIHIGKGTLRFENLSYLRELPLTGLIVDGRCQAWPQHLHVLSQFPGLERLAIDFGFNGIAQTMRAIEVRELEVLRKLPKLRELHIAGYGITSRVAPRLCNHPNLEVLRFGPCSVGAHGRIELKGLPKLRSLRLSGLKDRHIPDVLELPNLRRLEASAEDLTLWGFAALDGLQELKELQLTDFWTPDDQLRFLKTLDTYTAAELETVVAVHTLQLIARYEKNRSQQDNEYSSTELYLSERRTRLRDALLCAGPIDSSWKR